MFKAITQITDAQITRTVDIGKVLEAITVNVAGQVDSLLCALYSGAWHLISGGFKPAALMPCPAMVYSTTTTSPRSSASGGNRGGGGFRRHTMSAGSLPRIHR